MTRAWLDGKIIKAITANVNGNDHMVSRLISAHHLTHLTCIMLNSSQGLLPPLSDPVK